jgi:hypothetical protein
MRIKNRYQRNRAFHSKHWNRIRSAVHPYETSMPYCQPWYSWTTEEQIESHFEEIALKVRALESGTHKQWIVWNASADFRRQINKQRKARDRHKMEKIRNGNYELEFDKYHEDASWYYF